VLYERGGRYDPRRRRPGAFREYDDLDEFFATTEPRLQTETGRELFAGSASGTGPLATSRSPSGPSVRVASSTTVVELQNDDCRDSTAGSAAKIARTLTTEPVLKSESFHHACPRTLI